MKPTRSNPLFARFFGASLTSIIVLSGSAPAADVIKANNADALNLTTSWVSGVAPTNADVAVWDSTVVAANNPALGADTNWQGLKFTNPGGLVTVGTGANGFTIGAAGIDMSAATQDVVLSPSWFVLSTNQTWTVAAGRNLRLAKTQTGAANSDVDGSGGTITIAGGGTVDANQGTTGTGAGWSNYSGKLIVQSGATLRGIGTNAFAWGTSTAADAITLNGGTLAAGGALAGAIGNWSWNQPITLGASTTSTISAQNPDATARTLTFTGAITGTGNLSFSKTQAGGHEFWVSNLGTTAGVRTNIMGTGNITVTGVMLHLQAGGTGNVITHNNNIKLVNGTLHADDANQNFAGTITLEGANTFQARWGDKPMTVGGNIVDGGVSGNLTCNSNIINLNGINTYSGGTTITTGSARTVSSQGFGTGTVTCDGGQLYVNPTTVGGTSTVSALRTRSDVRLGNNVLLNISTGNLGMRQTGGFWIQASGTGTVGRMTSSSGTLAIASVDASWVTTTGSLNNADHQIQTPIVDFNGSTPLAVVKTGVNDLLLTTANTYTGGSTINGGRIRVNSNTGFGTGTVTVNSGSTAMLSGAGTYANNFAIAGTGVTEASGNLGAIRFVNNTISGNVSIAAGGARIGGLANSGTITGSLSGSGPLEINSSAAGHNGAITLTGSASGYTGACTLSQGSLTISSGFGGSVTKAAGTTLTNNGSIVGDHTHTVGVLQGTGSFGGNLTLNGTTAADVLNIVPGAMNVAGDVTLSGSTTIRASGLGGEVPVLTYGGSLTGDATNLSLESAGSFRPGTTFDTDTPGLIKLVVVGQHVTWLNSAANLTWNTTDTNWFNSDTSVADKYFQSDYCEFGDIGTGTITLVGSIAPRSITINNSLGNDYTFTGTAGNVIAGSTGITKTGAGALTLNSSNTFLGAVSLGGGLTTFSARQAYTGGTTVNGGAVLDLTGGGGEGGTIQGTVNISGTGSALRLTTGDATGWGTVPNRITAINISSGGALEINNGVNNQTFSNMAITLTGGSIVKGAGAVAYNGNFDCFNGSTSITSNASSDTSVIAAGVNVGLRQTNTTITTALGTTASGIDLRIDGSINNSPANFAAPNLVKAGTGTLCLNNPPAAGIGTSTVYTGTTTVNSGTLIIGTGGTTGIIGTGDIIDNAAVVFNRSDVLTVASTVSGTGTLQQKGPGTLNLTSGGARSGDTMVTAGRLNIGTTAFTASTFRANAGGTIGAGTTAGLGTGTVPGLVLNGGTAAFRVSTAVSDKIVVSATNGFTVNTASQISCAAGGNLQVSDTLQLIDYDGAIGGIGFAGLSLAASSNPHYSFALVNNTTDTRVDASVTAADTLIWKGNVDANWDKTTSNWATVSNNLTSLYYDYDKVKFTNAGSANTTVSLVGEITPAIVEFDASINYTLTGVPISGTAGLVKNNSGTATLINENTYTGATTVNGGTLQIGNGGTAGSVSATTVITDNATLAFNRSDDITDAHVIGGSGQLVKRGTGRLNLNGANTFTGAVVVEGGMLVVGNAAALGTSAGGLVANGGTANLNGFTLPAGEIVTIAGTGSTGYALTGAGTIQATLDLSADATIGEAAATRINIGTSTNPVNITGAHTLTKSGPTSTVWYRGVAGGAGNTLVSLVVNEGTFGIETYDNALGASPVTVNAAGILSSWANGAGNAATTQSTIITLNGGTLGSDFAGQTWSGPVTLAANSTLGATASAQNFTISGVISESAGSFGLTKTQASTVTLTAVNTYTGNTTVNAGTINLADNAGLKFVIGANGVNNKITGVGSAVINGDFTLDLSGANLTNGNSWTLVDTTTKAFGATFTLNGFTEAADVHTKVVGAQTWTFTESTGVLTLAISLGYSSWVANYPALPVDQRDTDDDYDGDGLNNLLEYVLGGSPLVRDAASTAPTGVKDGLGNFVVTFKRSDLSETDTTQVLQYGTNLTGWTDIPIGASPGAGMVAISEDTPNADLDTVTVTIPTAGAPKFFVHLKVIKP